MLVARLEQDPEELGRIGRIVLMAGFASALISLFAAVLMIQDSVWLFPVAVLTMVAAVALFRREEINLWVAISLFVLISGYEEGIQLAEVGYGLYFVAFLVVWYGRRFYTGSARLLTDAVDVSVAVFLLLALASVTWATLFGARPRVIAGEMIVLLMMAFYFPIKDALVRNPQRALRSLSLVMVWLGLFVFVRNVVTYSSALSSAEQLYEITKGRVALNEILQMVPALGALVFFLFAKERWQRLTALTLFLIFLAGTIITQSRGYWAAFGLGCIVLFFMIDRTLRIRLIGLAFAGFAGTLILGYIFFPGIIELILVGLIGRVLSLATALSDDISMVNRVYETAEIWTNIKANPILGYGIGTEYDYFSLIEDKTTRYAFVHNAYAGIWYKYGLAGFVCIMVLLVRSMTTGFRIFKDRAAPPMIRKAGLIVAICIAAEMLVANTSNPFLIADGMLVVAVLAATASACAEYVRRRASYREEVS